LSGKAAGIGERSKIKDQKLKSKIAYESPKISCPHDHQCATCPSWLNILHFDPPAPDKGGRAGLSFSFFRFDI
jgi:hypothetical protein